MSWFEKLKLLKEDIYDNKDEKAFLNEHKGKINKIKKEVKHFFDWLSKVEKQGQIIPHKNPIPLDISDDLERELSGKVDNDFVRYYSFWFSSKNINDDDIAGLMLTLLKKKYTINKIMQMFDRAFKITKNIISRKDAREDERKFKILMRVDMHDIGDFSHAQKDLRNDSRRYTIFYDPENRVWLKASTKSKYFRKGIVKTNFLKFTHEKDAIAYAKELGAIFTY